MATTHGTSGSVYIGANLIAEINEWTLDLAADFAETTNLAATAKTSHPTAITSFRGTVNCWWDDTDTNGQEAMTVGTSVTLKLRPEGVGSGLREYSGTCRIASEGINVRKGQITERAFSFEGSGTLTRGNQP
jgi:hypothetical protein